MANLLPLMLLMNSPLLYDRPARLLNQRFGVGLRNEDLISSLNLARDLSLTEQYFRPWLSAVSQLDSGSMITSNKEKFEVNLDVQQFSPDEVSVKLEGDNVIVVEGKHEEKQDEHGAVSRHFIRKYVIPKGHNFEGIASSLSSDGVLTITVPKLPEPDLKQREISIQQTGKPSKFLQDKTKAIEDNEVKIETEDQPKDL